MNIKVKYFGAIAEKTGVSEEVLHLDEAGYEVDELKAYCINKYDLEEGESIRLAVNQVLNAKKTLQHGDEVAFLPPYAGG